jgi:glycosyltransferase involved in cell wall biosynthesis
MLSLGPEFRLVVVGDGPERYRLVAYAGDLRISSRVHFVGAVSDAVLYRWLRTARVVVTLAGERGSGSQVTEACAAGASVVASDLPIHRRAAERSGGGHVIFVPPRGSPFDVADAIDEAARVSVHPSSQALAPAGPSWDTVIDSTWLLYEQLIGDRLRQRPEPAAMVGPAAGGGAANPADGCWWRSRRRRRGGLHGAQKWQ